MIVGHLTRKLAFLILFLVPLSAFGAEYYQIYKQGVRLQKEGAYSDARTKFLMAASLQPTPEHSPNPSELSAVGHYDPYVHLAFCEINLGLYDAAEKHVDLSRQGGITPELYLNRLEKALSAAKSGKLVTPLRKERRFKNNTDGSPTQQEAQDLPVVPDEPVSDQPEYTPPQAVSNTTPPVPAATSQPEPKPVAEPPTAKPTEPAVSEKAATHAQPPPTANQVTAPESPLMAHEKGLTLLLALILAAGGAVLLTRNRKLRANQMDMKAQPIPVSQLKAPAAIKTSQDDVVTRAYPDQIATVVEEPLPKRAITPTGATPSAIPLDEALVMAKPLPAGSRKTLGDYRLEGVLGAGGMGTTYLATRMSDDRTVALKIPHDHLLDNEDFVRRFVREGSLGVLLHHPNIVRIYESDRVDDKPFIAMELLKGLPLQKILKQRKKIPLVESLEIVREIALALDYASLKGVVHRDLKPDNIMMLDRGGLKVMDFGIARLLTGPGMTITTFYLGTPTYSAPEASAPGGADHRADLYSLGIILYKMLSGKLPFYSEDMVMVLEMHRTLPLPPIPAETGVPQNVWDMLVKLAAKDREDRYKNAEAFLVDLNHVLQHLPS
jgi:predicted Ser/Thr protein kinase